MDTAVIDTIVVEGPWGTFESIYVNELCFCDTAIFSIRTLNAISPTFLTGDGQAIPFSPVGLLGDTIYDTLKVVYCTLGSFYSFFNLFLKEHVPFLFLLKFQII